MADQRPGFGHDDVPPEPSRSRVEREHCPDDPGDDPVADTETGTDPAGDDELHVLSRGEHATDDPSSRVDTGGIGESVDRFVRGIGRAIVDVLPSLESSLRICRGTYAAAFVWLVCLRHRLNHVASVDPYRIYYVDPDRIVHVAEPCGHSRFRRAGTIVDGDWDRSGIRFVDTDLYRAFEARYVDGVQWSETAFYQRVVDEIRDGMEPWECDSPAAFERRCRRLDELFESVRENGFLTQAELHAGEADDPLPRGRGTLGARVLNDEIAVDIGRDGELLYADGRNRLAMAKVLDIDEIPVIVLSRHRQWAITRDAAATYADALEDLPPSLRRHPDIAVLFEESD